MLWSSKRYDLQTQLYNTCFINLLNIGRQLLQVNSSQNVSHFPPSGLSSVIPQPVVKNLYDTLIIRILCVLVQRLFVYSNSLSKLVPLMSHLSLELNQQAVQVQKVICNMMCDLILNDLTLMQGAT